MTSKQPLNFDQQAMPLIWNSAMDIGEGALSAPYRLVDTLNQGVRNLGVPIPASTAEQDLQTVMGAPHNPWLYDMGQGGAGAQVAGLGFGFPDLALPTSYAGIVNPNINQSSQPGGLVAPVDSGAMVRYPNGDGTFTVNYGNKTWTEDAKGNQIPLGPVDQPASQWNTLQNLSNDAQPQPVQSPTVPSNDSIENMFPNLPDQSSQGNMTGIEPPYTQPGDIQPFTGIPSGSSGSTYGNGPQGVPYNTDPNYYGGSPTSQNPNFPGWDIPSFTNSDIPQIGSLPGGTDSIPTYNGSGASAYLANLPSNVQNYDYNRGIVNYDPIGTSGIPNFGDPTSTGMGTIPSMEQSTG